MYLDFSFIVVVADCALKICPVVKISEVILFPPDEFGTYKLAVRTVLNERQVVKIGLQYQED